MRFPQQEEGRKIYYTVALGLFAILLAQTAVWAICYEFIDAFPNFATSVYFSVASFSTLGLGTSYQHMDGGCLAQLRALTVFL